VRRIAASLLFIVVLVGCGSDAGFYDDDAKALAKRAAQEGPFNSSEEVVSVESVKERHSCPQAASSAGPCLDVVVTSEITAQPVPGTHSSAAGAKVRVSFDAFIWLTKTGAGWKVTRKTYRPRGAALNGVPYSPSK
jgi:hypothetical protein